MSSCSCADRHRSRTAHASLVSEITGLLAGKGPEPGKPEPLLEPLSDSELRVLRYLPTNLTAPEIASEVYLQREHGPGPTSTRPNINAKLR